MTQRLCPGCTNWYPKKDGGCPDCGEPPARTNQGLVTASLNSHLYNMANRSKAQDRTVRDMRAGREP